MGSSALCGRAESAMSNNRDGIPLRAGGPVSGIVLTDEFQILVADRPLMVPHTVERVLAFLALSGHAVHRAKVAGELWFNASEKQAANNLRTALWRIRRVGAHLVAVHPDKIRLAPEVTVDVSGLSGLAHRLIHCPRSDDLDCLGQLVGCGELLPDWDDNWVVADRERFRLLRLEALERSAATLIGQQRYGEALVAALAAARTEPLRESACRLLMQVHTREGNVVEALRTYQSYRTLLRGELGLEPSPLMRGLVMSLAHPRR